MSKSTHEPNIVDEWRAKDRYANGWQPMREVLLRLKLPRRYPKGDVRNMNRALHVWAAQHKQKYDFKPCGMEGCRLCKVRLRFTKAKHLAATGQASAARRLR